MEALEQVTSAGGVGGPLAAGPGPLLALFLSAVLLPSLLLTTDPFLTTTGAHAWKTDRKPKVFGDRIPVKLLTPTNRKVQRKIAYYHNFFRSRVSPPASDMLSMSWHKGAARAAQKWANRCLMLTHDDVHGRWTDDYGSCGQNIFISTHQVPWFFAIKTWFMERHNFTYGSSKNDLYVVGHYTQMVWASTHKVGCGFARCPSAPLHIPGKSARLRRHGGRLQAMSLPSLATRKTYYSYICNYCPIGNFVERLGRPYKKGEPCSGCPDHCRNNKLCTNSCPVADLWINCGDLNSTWHNWLCNHGDSAEGQERQKSCKATCTCGGRII
ncbi:cysteine-rich secretory protein 2-like [Ischnura elegans]|uniref:cysteine-rich secretory protein 2-like n=1 Tax=Ischnura elegans TaxID=197161 RepID=UPI001ED88CFD|nr:cysteine-rich secretory protein 2-like [Ischnura elegans]XP_046403124.1 cysteine-rich secretory protein 2-like [Ischnura elegans]